MKTIEGVSLYKGSLRNMIFMDDVLSIGKNMDKIKKYLGFLNPTWAALKCYDEQEYLQMVQGESSPMTQPFGRLPRTLCKHPTSRNRFRKSASFLCLDRENLHPNRDCK